MKCTLAFLAVYLALASCTPQSGRVQQGSARRRILSEDEVFAWTIKPTGFSQDASTHGRTLKDKTWVYSDRSQALSTPVKVGVMTHHFFGDYARTVPDCHYEGTPFECKFVNEGESADADALWYHAPSRCAVGGIDKVHQNQLTVVMSMESAAYYNCLDHMNYMDQFDIEMTYRRCSHVMVPYFPGSPDELVNQLFADPAPLNEKLSAVAYINSNCHALNGRNGIVENLMNLKRLEVHAWGMCLRNKTPPQGRGDKLQIFRKYKFCIAMENSISKDYVTEKLWQALESGCLPIYYGAPNIMDFAPHEKSFIDYNDFMDPGKLMDFLEYLDKNDTAYMEHMAWKYMPLHALNKGFQKAVAMTGDLPHSQCILCQMVMQQRLSPVNLTQTHCLRNETYMQGSGRNDSGWGPGSDGYLEKLKTRTWIKGTWDPRNWAPIGLPRSASTPQLNQPAGRRLRASRAMLRQIP